jgi:hypothetical protein
MGERRNRGAGARRKGRLLFFSAACYLLCLLHIRSFQVTFFLALSMILTILK